jgi:hypothetical protein
MAGKTLGEGRRVVLRPLQPHAQRAGPANRQKRFQGSRRRTGELAGLPQRGQQLRVPHGDDAAEEIGVSSDELRR